jgi:hypothetical protein
MSVIPKNISLYNTLEFTHFQLLKLLNRHIQLRRKLIFLLTMELFLISVINRILNGFQYFERSQDATMCFIM